MGELVEMLNEEKKSDVTPVELCVIPAFTEMPEAIDLDLVPDSRDKDEHALESKTDEKTTLLQSVPEHVNEFVS